MSKVTLILVVATLLALPAFAEDKAEFGLRYATAQQENLDQIKLYQWTSVATVQRNGEIEDKYEIENRLNEKGELVQEVVGSESDDNRREARRGRRHERRDARRGNDDLVKDILAVAASYMFMSKGGEVDFFDNAKMTDGEDDLQGTRKVHGAGVMIDGDTVTKWVDPQTLQPQRIAFTYDLDGHQISGEVRYRSIENGPNVPRLSTIRILDEEQVFEIEYIGYEKQL
jgi:hypothetical protein